MTHVLDLFSDINKPELGYTGIQPWFAFFLGKIY